MNVAESRKRDRSHDDTRVGRNTRPQLSGLLCDRPGNGRALHFTLGVDNDAGVVLEVEEDAVRSPPWLALADNDGRHDLLPELRLSLLDRRHDHVSGATGGQAVETGTDALDGDDVQVAGTRVVAAVHDGADWQTKRHLQLVTGSRTTTALSRHVERLSGDVWVGGFGCVVAGCRRWPWALMA